MIYKDKKIIYNYDLYSTANPFKLLVFVIDSCNYKCEYCYNVFPRTNKKIDLKKLYTFITDILIKKFNKQNIQLELIGGEPTLHPELFEFCKKISLLPNINTTIFTNFSQDIEYYINLLNIDNRINLILSWHTANNLFVEKLKKMPLSYITQNITVSVIYEHNNIEKSLEVFDIVHNNYPTIRELSFPLIDNNINYYTNAYSKQDMQEYEKRLKYIKDLTHIKIEFADKTYKIIDQHYFIVNEQEKCFKHWLCNAGKDYCFIYYTGDICPCDGYRDNKKLGNLNNLADFQLNTKSILCEVDLCPCVFDVYKKRVFNSI